LTFAAGTRNTPLDGNNMNRVFPGSPGGWVTEKMTHVVTEGILRHIHAAIDFHPGAADTGIYYCYSQPPTTPYKKIVNDMARLANTPIIHETKPHPGSICEYAEKLDVPAVLPEIGGSFATAGRWLEAAIQGVWNIMTYRGMMREAYVLPPTQIVLEEDRFLRIGHGGLFFPEVSFDQMGTTVPAGTVLGRVVSAYTFDEVETIRAPFANTALMFMRGRFSKVEPGDYAYIVGNDTGRRISGFA
jgi:predicted deacylase